jgi:hypothetical protein
MKASETQVHRFARDCGYLAPEAYTELTAGYGGGQNARRDGESWKFRPL